MAAKKGSKRAAGVASSKKKEGRACSFAGDIALLTAPLSECIAKPSLIKYSEVMTDPINPELLAPWQTLWRSLLKVQPNLSFTQVVMSTALRQVALQKSWFAKSHQKELLNSFVEGSARRLRCMGRHLAQARGKGTRWVLVYLAVPLQGDQAPAVDEQWEEEAPAKIGPAEPKQRKLGDVVTSQMDTLILHDTDSEAAPDPAELDTQLADAQPPSPEAWHMSNIAPPLEFKGQECFSCR